MIHLSPDEKKIINYLSDHEFHCMANSGFYMKDDRARISALRKKGYDIEPKICDGRCNVNHNSGVVMRRWNEKIENHLYTPSSAFQAKLI